MKTTYTTTIWGFGNNAGIEVPIKAIEELNSGKRAPVKVTVGTYTYPSTIGSMNGKSLIPFAKVHRDASGLAAGDKVTVTLELDSGVRTVDMPEELQQALKKHNLSDFFSKLSYSKRKEFARQVADAKTDETRSRRLEKIIEQLQ